MKLTYIRNPKVLYLSLFFLAFICGVFITAPDIIKTFILFNNACKGQTEGELVRVMGLKKRCF
tara:strand:+ start:172 stop:360 length:189 start_codon:yes stop_codon:yes gene_type:complete